MRILIAVFSCKMREDKGTHQAIRETWMRDFISYPNVDCRFFIGIGGESKEDTIVVDAVDDYTGLSHKSKALHYWAFEHGYDFVFYVDDDTFINVSRVMASGFEKHDYYGRIHTWPGSPTAPQGYCCTGDGCWFSRKASEAIMNADVDDWADDRWMGTVVGLNGMRIINNDGYGNGITYHGSVHTARLEGFDTEWLYKMYREKK